MDCTLNLIDVRDVARGLSLVSRIRGRPGRRYLLGNENLTLLGLLKTAQRLDRRSGTALACFLSCGDSAFAARSVQFWADHVTGRAPRATLTGLRLGRRTMHFDPSNSLAEIGLRPKGIQVSLADAVSWLRDSGLLPTHWWISN